MNSCGSASAVRTSLLALPYSTELTPASVSLQLPSCAQKFVIFSVVIRYGKIDAGLAFDQMELNERLWTVKNAFISGSFSLFSAADIETISGLFVRTSSASESAKSSDVWQYFGPPLYCEYRTRLKFTGCKSLSCSCLVLFLVKCIFMILGA